MEDKKCTFNVSAGGQVNFASGNAILYVTQNNGLSINELDNIIKGIMDNLADLRKEDAEELKDIVDMVKEELGKPKPKASRLRNCVTLIAPMFTIANGIPTLINNLQSLVEYITPYIK